MSIAIDEFWVLAVESGLFTPDEARQQAAAFAGLKGAASRGGSSALARWLMARGALTHYQAKKLVAGHPTKFVYGDYVIQERVTSGHLTGLLRAIHGPSRQEVFLYFRDHDTPPGSQRMASAMQQAIMAEGPVRVIQAASSGCYQWHDAGKSRFFVLEACGPGDMSWQIFTQWLSPSAGTTPPTATPIAPAPVAQAAGPAAHVATLVPQPASTPRMAKAVPMAAAVMGSVSPANVPPMDAAQPHDHDPSRLPNFAAARANPRRSIRFEPPPIWIAAAAGATVALVAVVFLFSGGTGVLQSDVASQTTGAPATASRRGQSASDDPARDAASSKHTTTDTTLAEKGPAEAARAETVRAIDAPLWQSPTSGKPLDLAYLPSGEQLVIALRPADLLAHAEAHRLLDPRTLGPVYDWFTKDLPALAGQPVANIEQAIIGLLDGELLDGKAGPPRITLVIRLRESVPENELVKAWGGPAAGKEPDRKLFERDGRAWYLPRKDDSRTIVIGPTGEIRQVAANGDAPPVLQRELEDLLAASDETRHMTILFAPRFLFTGGKAMLAGPAERLKTPLDWFFSGHEATAPADKPRTENKIAADGKQAAETKPADRVALEESSLDLAKGAMLSLHLTDDLFAELRVSPDLTRALPIVAGEFRQRVAAVPKRVDLYVRSLALSPYSYDVLWQFPRMVEQVDRFTRVGFDGRQVVLRLVLPAVATHNLALGTHLALLENPRDGQPGVAPSGQAAGAAAAAPVGERLKRRISLVFPANTLEKAVQLLSEDLGMPIVILGADLQLEGITKNQTLRDLNERDQPAGEILRKIMLMASADGKLVYVVKTKEGGAEESLVITTRAAAAKRGDKLPEELAK